MARSCVKDPLEKFRFTISWDATEPKAGFHDVQMPKRTTNKIMYREGGDPDISTVSAGLSTMEDIVLNRGLFPSASVFGEIIEWIKKVHPGGVSKESEFPVGTHGSNEYRKTMSITMYDRDGTPTRHWQLFNAFPIHYAPGSDLNAAEDGEKSMESLTLAYEDFVEYKVESGVIDLGTTI